MSRRYSNQSRDPYWTTALFPGVCAKCGRDVKRHERIFYYPNGKKLYCESPRCGQAAAADFSAVDDERSYGGGY
jgi:hypothetical protein